MKSRLKLIFSALLVLLFCKLGCTEDPPVVPPPPPPPNVKDTITLNFEYSTHRSIIINATATANNKKSTIKLYRQFNNTDTLVVEYPITTNDTSIIDDNNGNDLQINTTYSYYAVRIDTAGERKDSSNFITAKTLAATSFNYNWQEFSLGDPGSVFYDVWGTDENNVYSCGVIIIGDSVYGVMHWNGFEWKPVKRNGGLFAIFGFSNNDIWTVGGSIFHFDGMNWVEIMFNDQILVDNLPYYSVWGTNSTNVYFGSGRGKIISWNGNKAQIVYSDPDEVFVKDLDGYSLDFIIGVGTGLVPPLLAVYYDGNNWSNLPISSNWSLNAISIATKNLIYFGGDGVFEMIGTNLSRIQSFGYYIWDVKYNRQTGVTVASGAFDGVYIYNGLEWRNYKGQITSDNTKYSGIFLVNNTIFCVGSTVNEAKIIIGNN
jgi:hypothetical protein